MFIQPFFSYFPSTNLIKMRTLLLLTWVVFLAFSVISQPSLCIETPGSTSGTLNTYSASNCTGNKVNTVSLVDNDCTLLSYIAFSDSYIKISCSSGSYELYYDSACSQSYGTFCQSTCAAVSPLVVTYSELTCSSLK